MALDKETHDALGRRLATMDLGLSCGLDDASKNIPERHMLWELLENQFAIMLVLAAMNGMSPNPKAYRELLDEQEKA